MVKLEEFPHLDGIFYAEFHPTQGPKVKFDYPEGLTSAINTIPAIFDFEAVSEYIIPKPELCDRLVTICTPAKKAVGYPVSILSQKYERNVFIFNLVFVFNPSAHTSPYDQVVKKMAGYLKNMEVLKSMLVQTFN
jgi:hypothetical protein